uniref:Uncharacterized protein n=1 Tax=Coprothermobacter proteolyticus (strain ATCC 35245 / DSM 5265 / OCM 4 / BT) TaxID=309798 RepID=B5Y666_COPPD
MVGTEVNGSSHTKNTGTAKARINRRFGSQPKSVEGSLKKATTSVKGFQKGTCWSVGLLRFLNH